MTRQDIFTPIIPAKEGTSFEEVFNSRAKVRLHLLYGKLGKAKVKQGFADRKLINLGNSWVKLNPASSTKPATTATPDQASK